MPSARAPKAIADKSALRIGASQLVLSLGLFGVVTGIGAGAVQLFGDPALAAPKVQVALFQRQEGPAPYLKTRLDNAIAPEVAAAYAHGADTGLAAAAGADDASKAGVHANVTITSFDNGPGLVASPLAKAPIPGFFERTAAGELPRINENHQTPAQAYARPFTPTGEPRISIVLGGLGLNGERTAAAINTLPAEITLSFVPYATDLQGWINKARAAGHEVLLELPMEPYDYPNVDTGPHTLLINSSAEENVRRVDLLLGKATGYFGVTNYQGAKFATDAKAANPVFEELSKRGLVFLHDGGAVRSALPDAAKQTQLGFRVADKILDAEPAREAIDRQLLQLEATALKDGQALGVGYGYPITIEQLKSWSDGLKAKGYQLAPASTSAGVRAMQAAQPSSLAPTARTGH
jgi:polysaccharide deacetylase 2 family uncharacterized protein YibQ